MYILNADLHVELFANASRMIRGIKSHQRMANMVYSFHYLFPHTEKHVHEPAAMHLWRISLHYDKI